tara:strand:- start:71 stop:253 length:183 start_codon:yes stop_codon:yes gene_type:complete
MKLIPTNNEIKATPTVPDEDGTSPTPVFHTLSENIIPKVKDTKPNINDINFISGFLKQYS